MYKKILVCLDGSSLAEKILPYAAEQATRFDSDMVLFRAISEAYLIGLALPACRVCQSTLTLLKSEKSQKN